MSRLLLFLALFASAVLCADAGAAQPADIVLRPLPAAEDRDGVLDALDDTEARIVVATNERRAIRLTGPVLTMVGGYVGGSLFLATTFRFEQVASDRAGLGGDIAADDARRLRNLKIVSISALVVGAIGTVWLAERVRKRRALSRELALLEERRTLLLDLERNARRVSVPTIAPALGPHGAVLSLTIPF